MPSRNEPCPCGSGRKYKRCCLERLEAVAHELRERDELLDDVIAWLKDEHEETLHEASNETTLIRMLRGPIGRNMSLVWALNDYVPADGGPSLMARYAERPELSPPARAIALGLVEARLDVYRVRSTVPGLWLEIEPLTDGVRRRVAWRDRLERLHIGEILVTRVVDHTTLATAWGSACASPPTASALGCTTRRIARGSCGGRAHRSRLPSRRCRRAAAGWDRAAHPELVYRR